jgi:glutathione S-transferase
VKLYYSDILSARKACAVARYLKSPVEWIYLDLPKGEQQTPAYLAINPNGKVPTLVEGERILWEADAVICRLAELAGSDLWPHDSRQIDIIRWFSWDAQHFGRHAGALYFENIVKARFGIGAPDRAAVEEALVGFRRFAAVLNEHLATRTWLVGDTLSVADFSVAVTLPYAAQACIPLGEFPAVRRWHERLCELEAWRDPFPPRPS